MDNKTGINSVEFHGDLSSSGNFVCQNVIWVLDWMAKLRFGEKDGCVAVYAVHHTHIGRLCDIPVPVTSARRTKRA